MSFDNEAFAAEFARRLNLLLRDYPQDMFDLGTQPLPTNDEGGSMVLWRVFSLLCLEKGSEGYLVIPHQSDSAICAIHAIPVSEHEEYRTKRKKLSEPDRLLPQTGNQTFAVELVRRINTLYGEYPTWIMRWLSHDLLVRHELRKSISFEDQDFEDLEVLPIGLSVLLSLACSANVQDEPFGIAPCEEISPEKIVQVMAGRELSEKPSPKKH